MRVGRDCMTESAKREPGIESKPQKSARSSGRADAGASVARIDGRGIVPFMPQRKWLNDFHRAYCERMKRAARKRSGQSPMSPAEFIQQVRRLRRGQRRRSSAI